MAGKLLETTGVAARIYELAGQWQHAVTRYRIRLLLFLARRESTPARGRGARTRRIESSDNRATRNELRWVDRDEMNALPLSATGRKIAQLLAAHHGKAQQGK